MNDDASPLLKEEYEQTALDALERARPDPAEHESIIWQYELVSAVVHALLAIAQAIEENAPSQLRDDEP